MKALEVVISNIQLRPISTQNGLVAFASCELNNCFFVGSIALYTSPTHSFGYRCVFPTKKLASGKQVPCFYPFRRDVEEAVTKSIVDKYVELMGGFPYIERVG